MPYARLSSAVFGYRLPWKTVCGYV
jgi:hypothetical protein